MLFSCVIMILSIIIDMDESIPLRFPTKLNEISFLIMAGMLFFFFNRLYIYVVDLVPLVLFKKGVCVPSISRKIIKWDLVKRIGYYRKDDGYDYAVRIELTKKPRNIPTKTIEVGMNEGFIQELKSTISNINGDLWAGEVRFSP